MNELKTSEVPEIKTQSFRGIKPKTDLNVDGSKSHWDNKFSSKKSETEKSDNKNETEKQSEDIVKNPRVEYVDGHNNYYDDNGKLYRVDKDLVQNSEYTVNGYDYKTDEHGRIVEASGKLRLKEHSGHKNIKDSLQDVGKGDENKKTDDKGHLIGDQFGGKDGLENAVAQDANINRNDYRKLEDNLANRVKAGDDVRVKIEPRYKGDSHRPDQISVIYSINGEVSVQIFPNSRKG